MRRTTLLLLLTAILVACGNSQNGDRNGGRKPSNVDSSSMKMSDRPRADAYAIPGFAVYAEDERLWVFREGSNAHEDFLAKGEPAKRVSLIGIGPEGRTLYGSDADVMKSYAAGWEYRLPGFAVFGDGDRLWVFREGSDALDEFLEKGEPAKRVSLIGVGPEGRTLYGEDREVMKSYAASMKYATPGFAVIAAGERLWVFREKSEGLDAFLEHGEPAKRVSLVAAGPDGRTLYGSEAADMRDFANSWKYRRDGFVVLGDEGRLWVFREGSPAYAEFLAKGEPAKRVTRVGAGPDGLTVYGADEKTLAAYCAPYQYGQPGFAVIAEDGRLWIFRNNSANHRMFLEMGEPAKSVTLIGAGPGGQTLRGIDKPILEDYMAHWNCAAPGYVVHGDEGRLWVFRAGSEAYRSFLEHGEPAKRVSLIGVGPDGKTLYGADANVLRAYADSFQQQ